jgi:hypothetical protein
MRNKATAVIIAAFIMLIAVAAAHSAPPPRKAIPSCHLNKSYLPGYTGGRAVCYSDHGSFIQFLRRMLLKNCIPLPGNGLRHWACPKPAPRTR